MPAKSINSLAEAQQFVKDFAIRNQWSDHPNIDKFDHLHEELVEMSKLLRYQDEGQRLDTIHQQHDQFVDGIGDLLFALCRLANQLEVDLTEAFNSVATPIANRYTKQDGEHIKNRQPMANNIEFATFTSIDLRVGTIVEAKIFDGAHKPAYQLLIDLGDAGRLGSSAQITQNYQPGELIGKQVVCVCNLGDKHIGPFISQVLTLGSNDRRGHVVLISPDQQVPNGSKIY
jgi:tRNA-binding protein